LEVSWIPIIPTVVDSVAIKEKTRRAKPPVKQIKATAK